MFQYLSTKGSLFLAVPKYVADLASIPNLASVPKTMLCCNAEVLRSYMLYRKNSKNWDTLNYFRDCPTNGKVGF